MIAQDTPQDIPDFIAELQRQEVAPKTIASYRSDLQGFAQELRDFTPRAFTAPAVRPTDLRPKGMPNSAEDSPPPSIVESDILSSVLNRAWLLGHVPSTGYFAVTAFIAEPLRLLRTVIVCGLDERENSPL